MSADKNRSPLARRIDLGLAVIPDRAKPEREQRREFPPTGAAPSLALLGVFCGATAVKVFLRCWASISPRSVIFCRAALLLLDAVLAGLALAGESRSYAAKREF
jgi:hypothetical protein